MLKAICKNDYERILTAQKYIDTHPSFTNAVQLERIEDRHLTPSEIKALSYNEAYGVWFDKEISQLILESASCQSRVAYLNEKVEKIETGIHKIAVADREALLYFWKAQGYPRGVIVLTENEDTNTKAAEITEKKPWDWTTLITI